MGSYSTVQCIRHLMDQPLYCSAADAGMWGERDYGTGSTRYAWPRSITLLPWLPAFLHRHFPSQSPSSPPLNPSLHSPQQPSPWDCSTIPKLQPPAALPSGWFVSLCQVCMAAARTVLILIPFRLPQISCFTLSLKHFSSDSDKCPNVGLGPLFQFPHLPKAGPVLLTLLFLPLVPSSYWVLHGSGQVFRRRQWHPTPVLLPGKSHGQRSLIGYSPWGH